MAIQITLNTQADTCEFTNNSSTGKSSVAAGVNRRSVLRGALGASALALPLTGSVRAQDTATPVASDPGATTPSLVRVYPAPASVTASPWTQISFRSANLQTIQPIEVVGSSSGDHTGINLPHSDGNGVSWLPDFAFHPGEDVTVKTQLEIVDANKGDFSFTICTPRALGADPRRNSKPEVGQVHVFKSRPELAPQVIEVVAHGDDLAPGLLFISPKQGAGPNGAMIMDSRGEPVWFYPVESPIGQINDLRVQELNGDAVLTWWQGIVVRGHSFGHWVIRDASYQEVGTIRVGNGYAGGDLHELVLTRQNTALVGAYNTIEWDLRPVNGKKTGDIIDCIVQEIDIPTGAVMFEWHSLEHVALEESHDKVNQEDEKDAFDHFHFNAITLDQDDNLVISARNTWAGYKVDRVTGEIIWRLGGKMSDFEMGANAEMAYQHDIRLWPNGEVTLFDNGGVPQRHDESRGLVLRLDMARMTADVEREYLHPDHVFTGSQGNMQVLENGNVLIGWGGEPLLSEFTYDGELLCDWRMFERKQSYRAYRFGWTGKPADAPSLLVESGSSGTVTVFVSWNGATEVAAWRLRSGPGEDALTPEEDTVPKAGFETTFALETTAKFFAVDALDTDGNVLGTSRVVEARA